MLLSSHYKPPGLSSQYLLLYQPLRTNPTLDSGVLLFKSTSENSTSGLRLQQHMAVCSGATGTPAHSSVYGTGAPER